jgi:hypothetical protein
MARTDHRMAYRPIIPGNNTAPKRSDPNIGSDVPYSNGKPCIAEFSNDFLANRIIHALQIKPVIFGLFFVP